MAYDNLYDDLDSVLPNFGAARRIGSTPLPGGGQTAIMANPDGSVQIGDSVRQPQMVVGNPAPGISSLVTPPKPPPAVVQPQPFVSRPPVAMSGKRDSNGAPIPAGSFSALPFEARSGMLAQQFGLKPDAARALTNNLWSTPGNIPSVLGGTHLDPAARALPMMEFDARQQQVARENESRDVQNFSHLASVTAAADKAKRESAAIGAAHAAMVGGQDPVAAYLGKGGTDASMISSLRREKPQMEGAQEDPVTGERFQVVNGQVVKLGTNPAKSQKQQPTTELARLMRERDAAQAAGKADDVTRYNDAIENWHAARDEKPLTLNEFWASPTLTAQFKDKDGIGDYALYRQNHAATVKRLRANAETQASGGAQSGSAATNQGKGQSAAVSYKSADDVRAAYRANKISREQAISVLQSQFGHK